MNYYYLVASLPPLVLGEAPLMPAREFLDQCRDHLLPADFEAVDAVFGEGGETEHPLLAGWYESETQLRNAIATARARRRQQDAAPFLRPHEGFQMDIEQGVSSAFAAGTPLDRERALDTIRWRAADEFPGVSEFSSATVVAYALKLKIAERWAAMDEETGTSQANALINMPVGGTEGLSAK